MKNTLDSLEGVAMASQESLYQWVQDHARRVGFLPLNEHVSRVETLVVRTELDTHEVRHRAQVLARTSCTSFYPIELSCFITALSELAMNLVRHAGGGIVALQVMQTEGGRWGMRAWAADAGPGIVDIELAVRDGYSTTGSLGNGLPGAQRLADDFKLRSIVGQGTVVTLAKYARLAERALLEAATRNVQGHRVHPYSFGSALISTKHAFTCGDNFFYRAEGPTAIAAVVDGLGHGHRAQTAANRVITYLNSHYLKPFIEIFRELNLLLQDTVGVAFALVRMDAMLGRLVFAGVGNVRGRIFGARERYLESASGVLGQYPETVQMEECLYTPGELVALFSDGITQKFSLASLTPLARIHPQRAADEIMARYALGTDDAVILVMR